VPQLVALDLPGGPAFVEALQRVWDDGDAVLPLDRRLPAPARERVLAALAPAAVIDEGGARWSLEGGRPVEQGDALVVATSGTTGEPKGVVLTHDAVAASAHATSARLGVVSSDHWLACLPLSHVGGLSVVTRALATGTALTVQPGFEVRHVEAAVRAGANLVSLVATALRRIEPGWFRWIVLGGSRAPDDLPGNVVTTYGMTETGSGLVYDGLPVDGAEVRVGPAGEIAVRGPMLLRCYRDGSDPKDAEGWFATGDVGAWEGAGADARLVVHGRAGDLIITGGENVWPEAVEAALDRASGVAEVCVAGRPDREWGQRVVAFVVPRDHAEPPTLEALRAAAKEHLPAYAAPRQLVLVDALPRTPLGKVQRALLP
jgi:O-succinylbenzoic acid--CoA ligase